jgi:adenine-specific DNA-methyltransferase
MDKTKGTIIESDNLPALDFLCQTYKSKIQVCIIDPPYNTNISGIGYEDNFDDYSEMIKNVLIKLNNLLKENGVVFISIDVNEVFSIANISKKIFGSDNVDILV